MQSPWIHEVVSIPLHVHQHKNPAVICGSVARLSCLSILFSRRWFRSSRSFSGRNDVGNLPDTRYWQNTREMVVRENLKFIATSEMLCPIFHAPTKCHVQNHLNLGSGNRSNYFVRHLLSVGAANHIALLWSVICTRDPITVFLALQCILAVIHYICDM